MEKEGDMNFNEPITDESDLSLCDPQFDQKLAYIQERRRRAYKRSRIFGATMAFLISSAVWLAFVNLFFINDEPYHPPDGTHSQIRLVAGTDGKGSSSVVYDDVGYGGHPLGTKLLVWGVGIVIWGTLGAATWLDEN